MSAHSFEPYYRKSRVQVSRTLAPRHERGELGQGRGPSGTSGPTGPAISATTRPALWSGAPTPSAGGPLMRARFGCFRRDDSQRTRRAWRTRSSARHKRRQSPSATSCTIKKIAPHSLGLLQITNAARSRPVSVEPDLPLQTVRDIRWRPRPSPVGLEAEMRKHLASKLD
jgi:hypothetical protein